MAWQRFNRTTNVFEVSDNNGASWQTLVIAAAGLGSPALPANIAYTNVVNTFISRQVITGGADGAYHTAPWEIQMAPNPRISFHWPGVVASQIGMGSDGVIRTFDNPGTGYAGFACSSIYAAAAGTSLADLTCRGAAVVMSNLQTAGYVYPGPLTAPGTTQGSWYLGSHSSYGLYSNTGIYNEGGVYTALVEGRQHIRAAAGLYDYGRNNPIGTWIAFTPQFGAFTPGTIYGCKYMIFGKTMVVSIYINGTFDAGVPYLVIPAGALTAGHYFGTAGIESETLNPFFFTSLPNSNIIYIYRTGAGGAWAAGIRTITAQLMFEIQ